MWAVPSLNGGSGRARGEMSVYGVQRAPRGSAVVVMWPERPVWPEQSSRHAEVVVEVAHTGPSSDALMEVTAALEGVSRALWQRFVQLDQTRYWQWLRQMGGAVLEDPPSDDRRIPQAELEWIARLGRAVHTVNDPAIAAACAVELNAEIDAIEQAQRGELTGRAAQAREMERAHADPHQVAAGVRIFRQEALGVDTLRAVAQLEPASAAVAAATWLRAASRLWEAAVEREPRLAVANAPLMEPLLRPLLQRVTDDMLIDGLSPRAAVERHVREAGAMRLFSALSDGYMAVRQQLEALALRGDDGNVHIGSELRIPAETTATPTVVVRRKLVALVDEEQSSL